ncbi:hypothetical protein TREES_T100006782 [Tupaia chinensis]|uniref:Uncharacterized protein n=1 Tax=Tupaia chinensis TaxID=246437 RepID=L9KG99_TUPCH|nr:hypothetical protein TREES_T100006782 [Tupaia chinensis]
MAYLHTGSAARAPPGLGTRGSQPAGTRRGQGHAARAAAPVTGAETREKGVRCGPRRGHFGRVSEPELQLGSRGGEEFRFSGTFQKRRRSGAGGSASPALVWEPFRKIKLRKETERSRDTTVKPLLTFLAAQNSKQERGRAEKKKKKAACIHGS